MWKMGLVNSCRRSTAEQDSLADLTLKVLENVHRGFFLTYNTLASAR